MTDRARAAAALGVAAGLLYWLGLPGGLGWPCALGSFAPLAWAAAGGPRSGATAGAAMGLVASALSFRFLPALLASYGGVGSVVGALVWFGASVVTAAPFAALGASAAWTARRGVPVALGLALGHAVIEAHAPRLLRWSFAAAFVDAAPIVSAADIVGAPLVGAVAVFLGATCGVAARKRAWRTMWPAAAVATCCLALWAARSPAAPSGGRSLSVAVIQPGTANPRGDGETATWERHRTLAATAAAHGAELIVGAEGVVPGVLPVERVRDELPGQPTTTVVGAVIAEGGKLMNSALVSRAGVVVGRHDKHWLVPLSEASPAAVADWLGKSALTRGATPRAVEADVARLGVSICYEEMIDDALVAPVAAGAEVLVSLSHDAWFDGTTVGEVQLAHARLRAIENRRWLLRASTTGVSAIISPSGEVVARSTSGGPTTLVHAVEVRQQIPPAARFHVWLITLPAAVWLAVLAWGEYRRRRSVQRNGPVGPEIDSLTAPWH